MHSELLSLFGLHIQTYGLLMAVGFILCYFAARRLARLTGRDERDPDTIVMLAAIGGILGARSVYVWQNWGSEFASNPLAAFRVWQGGLVFYGGFLLAAALILVYAKLRREPLRSLADFCAVFVPLGHAFGRVGCFFHGCCFGGRCESALGVSFPHGSPAWLHQVARGEIGRYTPQALPVWPTQLIEAAGCLLLFGLLWWLYRTQRARRGLCAGVYCSAYALLRFVGEWLRDDPRGELYFGLTFSQCISVGLLLVGSLLIITALWRHKNGTIDR